MMKRAWISRLFDSISQFFNVLLLNGDPDESISGRSYRRVVIEGAGLKWKIWRFLANALYFLIDDHTRDAYYDDIQRAQVRLERHYKYHINKSIE